MGTSITAGARRRQAFHVTSRFPAGRRMSGESHSKGARTQPGGHPLRCQQRLDRRNIRQLNAVGGGVQPIPGRRVYVAWSYAAPTLSRALEQGSGGDLLITRATADSF
jgi:hypothetical protein